MRIFRPRHTEGRVFLILAAIPFIFVAIFAALIGIEALTDCEFNEGGSGECIVAGVNIMEPVSLIGLTTIVAALLTVPVCLLGMLVTGLISLFRRRW